MSKSNNVYIQKARKKRMIKRTIYLTILFIIILVLVVWKSGIFSISNIEITGDTIITGKFVEQKTDYLIGNNILLISKDEIKNIIMKNPYVSDVEITRNLPKTLTIEIKEAKGLYYQSEDVSTYSIISDKLVLLERVDELENNNLVELKGFNTEDKELGDIISDDTRVSSLLDEFYREQEKIIENNENFKITSLDLTNLSDIQVGLGNIKVYLGNDQDIRKKMSDAIQIYKSGRVTSYIKVGFEGTPDFK
ncbi:MAG: FtsQ-type POTRA domain-containing protein [Clostridium sp.]|nr:FtsQ-type POTRA domain-containing protein [Clostridium sp.]MDY3827873.1 FtsQ-type POTRA domain-containing protein [Clostridium sp.]